MANIRIFRTTAAAEYLGLAASTLEKMRLCGEGPDFIRLGGRAIGYDVKDLDDWLDGLRVSGGCSDSSSASPTAPNQD